jgi:NCAIR mutase (PurE)-related protein
MDGKQTRELLDAVAAGAVAPEEAVRRLQTAPFEDLGYAKVDHQRGLRQGVSEVIYGEGKTVEQIRGICASMREAGQSRVLITRLSAEKAARLDDLGLDYRSEPRIGIIGGMPTADGNGTVVVAAAGTSDLPVAEEAALTAEFLGNGVVRLYDVGVAGIHRLLAHVNDIERAQVIVAAAGMEGALPSVVAGLASCPVIAVPTSVGYGASMGGLAALLAMLNSCASGISVVNIDNGFGAGYQASMINHVRVAAREA